MPEDDSKIRVADFTLPLSLIGTIAGGIVWLTSLHNSVERNADRLAEITKVIQEDYKLASSNERRITELRADYMEVKSKIFDRQRETDARLSRIEGKLDVLLEKMTAHPAR